MSLFDDEAVPETAVAVKPTIQKVRYTHDALIDIIIAEPSTSQRDLAKVFGYTEAWMSIIINSDAFKERLADRKAVLTDPAITASIEDRLGAVAKKSLDLLLDRLDNNPLAIRNNDLVSIAKLGVGDKNQSPKVPEQQTNLYVVNLPPPAPDAKTWVKSAQGRKIDEISDARVYE